jgi:hypothetical protein
MAAIVATAGRKEGSFFGGFGLRQSLSGTPPGNSFANRRQREALEKARNGQRAELRSRAAALLPWRFFARSLSQSCQRLLCRKNASGLS